MLEILAPAGNLECAHAAINNGADAIYLGLPSFSARQSAENFDNDAFLTVLEKAHFCGVKVYVAMNTIIKDCELESFFQALLFAWGAGVDAIILQDPFLGRYIHEKYPEIVLHLSTQAGVCNEEGALFAKECGFSRVILARETPIAEMRKIAAIIETEAFVQGALCTAFSGQCYFSSFVGGNSGNRGRCKQPCRKLYAYNRNGNEEKNYALSLSDLCVGEDISKLIGAGITSFKIEGRMRRAEYVSAAVRYYRSLLDQSGGYAEKLSDLKRAYNRGNYTKGLAFGQDKRFLSTAIQGHLGEKIGVVKVIDGAFFVESKFLPRQGDSFKILRDGKEVGGASFFKAKGRGFLLYSKHRLKNGDGVFITSDTEMNERLLSAQAKGAISLTIRFVEGEHAFVQSGDLQVYSDDVLQSADNRPLTEEEIRACFSKTDGLPIEVQFDEVVVTGKIFIPKSQLNALRRKFYMALKEKVAKNGHTMYEYVAYKGALSGKNDKLALIATDFDGVQTDIAIYKADDYSAALPTSFVNGTFEKYLYYPALMTEEDTNALANHLKECDIDGVYAENYAGIIFAKRHGLKIFAGTGFNLINTCSINNFLQLENAAYYAISKEANAQEGGALVGAQAFVLSSGNIKLMDLCYCPFGKTCAVCDKKRVYTLTDENGRSFPVRRYVAQNGACRFEVYNCADLIGTGLIGAGKLMDITLVEDKQAAISADTCEKQKKVYKNHTSGHFSRGVL